MADDEVVEEWAQLFGIVAAFLRDCERNEDTIDVNFVEYVCERLERTISSIGIVNIAVTDASDPELTTQISNRVNELIFFPCGVKICTLWKEIAAVYAYNNLFDKTLHPMADHHLKLIQSKFYSSES